MRENPMRESLLLLSEDADSNGLTGNKEIRIPFSSEYSYLDLTSKEEMPVDGWIDGDTDSQGNRLYVNRGVGMSIVPM